VDESRIQTRKQQGWVSRASADLGEVFDWVAGARARKQAVSIAYHGNVVDVWRYVCAHKIPIELASDQTSCHAVYEGGYTPYQLSFEQGRDMLKSDPKRFAALVDESLAEQFRLIREKQAQGTYFWDYGNAFMKAVFDAGCQEIAKNGTDTSQGFIFPSYVENIMGPICFDFGYGPFRWVCLSGKTEDLRKTDHAAMSCIDPNRSAQDRDNYQWIKDAERNNLVVGTKARILYADAGERIAIARRFNDMVRKGDIGPVMLGRDHHDVSGTDSPFRETANIKDGSNVMAEMAVHCFAGNAMRGMSLAVLSNGGGVGVGKCFNGGFGLVLDGTERVDRIIGSAMEWDVMSGVARRSWAKNKNAMTTARRWNQDSQSRGVITMPHQASNDLINDVVRHYLGS